MSFKECTGKKLLARRKQYNKGLSVCTRAHMLNVYIEYDKTHFPSFLLQGFQVEVKIKFNSGLELRLGG